MKKLNIAILGATSHIAKGLISNFIKENRFRLHLYSRSLQPLNDFFRSIGKSPDKNCTIQKGYDNFHDDPSFDVLINCVGVGTKKRMGENYHRWFAVTEEFDNLCIAYLRKGRPDSLYISFSSGAVYGRGLEAPMNENSLNRLPVNHICPEDYYAIARLNAETKHRSFKQLRIVDLRVFSYFSKFADLTEGYFITEVLDCILNNKALLTNGSNIVRDYIHPYDLFSLILKCLDTEKINTAFDVMSRKPVEKNEMLHFFSKEYGLKYTIDKSLTINSGTGSKNVYCSNFNKAAQICWHPRYTSMETISHETRPLIDRKCVNTG